LTCKEWVVAHLLEDPDIPEGSGMFLRSDVDGRVLAFRLNPADNVSVMCGESVELWLIGESGSVVVDGRSYQSPPPELSALLRNVNIEKARATLERDT